jgi:hypothetical protein
MFVLSRCDVWPVWRTGALHTRDAAPTGMMLLIGYGNNTARISCEVLAQWVSREIGIFLMFQPSPPVPISQSYLLTDYFHGKLIIGPVIVVFSSAKMRPFLLLALCCLSRAGHAIQNFQRDANWTVGQTVQTSSGPVSGHASTNASQVSEYLGIPYAIPPLGELRFAAPQAYTGNSSINGTKFVCFPHTGFSFS